MKPYILIMLVSITLNVGWFLFWRVWSWFHKRRIAALEGEKPNGPESDE